MKVLKTIRNYFCYCGIEKDEYNAVKKAAYISNFRVWRILQIIMVAAFGSFLIISFFSDLTKANRLFYLCMFLYSAVCAVFFFKLKEDSLIAQFLIYLSISALLLFGCFISQNSPDVPCSPP